MTRIINQKELFDHLKKSDSEYALIQNPTGVFPAVEIAPLSKKITSTNTLKAVVCDMDGTLTTTEGLCLHSLETMVKRWMSPQAARNWSGLDPEKDYPHVIGNSTTRHVEYLMESYGDQLHPQQFTAAFIHAAQWLLVQGKDMRLKEDVRRQLQIAGGDVELFEKGEGASTHLRMPHEKHWVAFAVTIYYQRYHEILRAMGSPELQTIAPGLDALIESMPGVGLFLTLVKGWLTPKQMLNLYPLWIKALPDDLTISVGESEYAQGKKRLWDLTEYFQNQSLGIGLVTSSIDYEMRIVLKAVFREISGQIQDWNLDQGAKSDLLAKFSDYRQVLDVRVNASASSEGRLKPHGDLYSMALQQLGVPISDFDKVIGFEDSESGTVAMRAAGIGLAMAVPFQETSKHDLSAASAILTGGLAEAVIIRGLFLNLKDESN